MLKVSAKEFNTEHTLFFTDINAKFSFYSHCLVPPVSLEKEKQMDLRFPKSLIKM